MIYTLLNHFIASVNHMLIEYLSVAEVAKTTHIHYHTLMARIRSGNIPSVKVGKIYLIHKDVVPTIQPPTEATSRARG